MNLQSLPAPEHQDGYEALYRSADGLWSIGLYPVIFGVRVVAWREGAAGRAVDYCAGADAFFTLELLAVIAAIFRRHLPDGATEDEVTALMPGWQRRPISRDPCWPALQQLATTPPTPCPPSFCNSSHGLRDPGSEPRRVDE